MVWPFFVAFFFAPFFWTGPHLKSPEARFSGGVHSSTVHATRKTVAPMAFWGPCPKKALYFRAKNRAAGPKAPALAPRLAPLPFWPAGDRRPFGRPEAGAPTGRPKAGAPTGRPEAGAPKTAAPPEAPPALSAKTQSRRPRRRNLEPNLA